MLRVFIDTDDKICSYNQDNVNVQYLSIVNKIKDKNAYNRFKDYLKKCLIEGDKIIILTRIDIKLSLKNDNIKTFIVPLPESGMDLVLNQIIVYKEEELDFIESKLKTFLELFELLYYSLVGV